MRPRIFLLLVLLLAGAGSTAQSDCFQYFFGEGKRALDSKDIKKWGEAELYFNAAYHCLENDEKQKSQAREWKEKANQQYIEAIKKARDSVVQANELIVRQSLISTALSWSFFAQEEAAKDSLQTALPLAFKAYKTVRENPTSFRPLVQKSFGNTIYANSVLPLAGHQAEILEVLIAPDGTTALTRSRDNTARIWDIHTGAAISTLGLHSGFIHAMAYAPDGSRIATASADSTARLWRRNGQHLKKMQGHEDEVLAITFAPDGRMLSGSRDGTACLWDRDGNLARTLKGHDGPVLSVAFAGQGGKILTATARQIRIWNSDGSPLSTITNHGAYIYSARFSPDGTKVLAASADSTAAIWSIAGEKTVVLKGHRGIVHNAWFSRDGTRIITISTDGKAKAWEATGQPIAELSAPEGLITSATFSPDGERAVVVSKSKIATLWDLRNPEAPASVSLVGHADEVVQARFGPKGENILTASRDHTAKLWDLGGNVILDMDKFQGPVLSTAFSPDGSHLLAASADKTAAICEEPESVFRRLLLAPPQLTAEQESRFDMR